MCSERKSSGLQEQLDPTNRGKKSNEPGPLRKKWSTIAPHCQPPWKRHRQEESEYSIGIHYFLHVQEHQQNKPFYFSHHIQHIAII